MVAIECQALTRDFGSVRAVDHLDLNIPTGSVFALLGANGAGKTTTIHLLLGLLTPTSGRAAVLGFDARGQADAIRARCGVLLEHHGLYERLTAWENLELYGRIAGLDAIERPKRVNLLLEHFGLDERRHHRVGMLSRGMKQKLALARALIARPPILFLDEPTAGLDPQAVVEIRNDLASLAREENSTIFLNTHNLADAEKLSDVVGVMREGKLLAVGTLDELRGRVNSVAMIRGAGIRREHADAIATREEVVSATIEDGGMRLVVESESSLAPIVRHLVERGADIEEVRRERAGLEDIFLDLVREEV